MKKLYMTPMTETIMIVPQMIIAASLLLNQRGQEEYEVMDETDLLSRKNRSVWDEEDDCW